MKMPSRKERTKLRQLIEESLRRQGFRIRDDRIVLSKKLKKEKLRRLHCLSVQHRIEEARSRLARWEHRLIQRIASGPEIDLNRISPRLVEVRPDSENELLFRYASL